MKIEKNIPIPKVRGRKGKYAFAYDMEFGDSVLVHDDVEKQKLSAHIRYSDSNCRVVLELLKTMRATSLSGSGR